MKMDLTEIKAIVFDLEGTLLDRKKSRDKFIEEQYERFHDYLVRIQLADFRKRLIMVFVIIQFDKFFTKIGKLNAYEIIMKSFILFFYKFIS